MSYLFRKILATASLTMSMTALAQDSGIESPAKIQYKDSIALCFYKNNAAEVRCSDPITENCKIVNIPEKCCDECGQLFVEAEFLYLRPFQGGFNSVCDSTHISDTTEDGLVISRLCGKGREPNFKWDMGFRVGAGYEFADNYTDIVAYYTRFHSRVGGHQHHSNQQHWKIEYDVVDLLYRVKCDWAYCFNISPFAGVKYANIDQNIRTRFTNVVDGSLFSSRGRSNADFRGAGPQLGVEAGIDLGCNFSLYGNISVAVLYGNFHVKSRNRENFATGRNIDRTTSHFRACQSVVDSCFGARYRFFYCDCRYVDLEAGFEQHRYFNFNQICDYGDFSLDGISVGLIAAY